QRYRIPKVSPLAFLGSILALLIIIALFLSRNPTMAQTYDVSGTVKIIDRWMGGAPPPTWMLDQYNKEKVRCHSPRFPLMNLLGYSRTLTPPCTCVLDP